jgi:hypothetical protein
MNYCKNKRVILVVYKETIAKSLRFNIEIIDYNIVSIKIYGLYIAISAKILEGLH